MSNDKLVPHVYDMLQNLQVHVLEAHYTQCWPDWQDLDYVPEYNKLYLIVDGEGWLKVGGQEFYPKPGQLCLLPAHMLQSYSTISDRPFLKYWCHFTATMGQLPLFQWLEVPYCTDVSHDQRIGSLFKELIILYYDNSLTARLREKAILLELISLLLDQHPIEISSHQNVDMERLAKIRQYIEDHIQYAITVKEIAQHIHLHPNYFIKYFKKHFSISPLKYVNRLRMEKAKLLLQTTSLSIKEVASQTGYDDTNHFAKSFRRESGFSPSEYRTPKFAE